MRIQEWPSAERPREKLLAGGAGALSDAELLALILGSGVRGHDAVGTARRLLAEHGPLASLLEQPPARLLRMRGIGTARACALKAALELAARSQMADLERGGAVTDPPSAGRYLAQRLRGRPHEVFAAMFLNSRHAVIGFEELFQGTVDGAEVHPRVLVRRAMHHNAAAVIVGHNHPSGHAEPSASDRAVTQRLKQALALIDVRLIDHFVIGDGKPVSMAIRGWV
ncbi:DNA repair protein RadC [Lysobacter enzymogenes]|jgi:DNA repair protein RadC|uniref:DNA repair protein RadC n=1 Tax=Lysobacter enzymogenes TaxID=69 RepID=A0AAU9B130_LYSEN|nr:DNA repair protein RadC [Lysobacter enzymogenes]BAW00180.1 DNA repair protein RadC [Lysobacter enzymogenes]SDX80240.1 DNA repair protein RadC [Lysobacter enzymogenes]